MVTKVTFNFKYNKNGASGLPVSWYSILPSSLLAVANVGFCKSEFEIGALLPSLYWSIISLEHYDFTFYLLAENQFGSLLLLIFLCTFIFVPSNGWNFHITVHINTQHQRYWSFLSFIYIGINIDITFIHWNNQTISQDEPSFVYSQR